MSIQHLLGGLSLHDERSDLVRVALVGIARFSDPGLQVHAAALLHDVRGLMRRGE